MGNTFSLEESEKVLCENAIGKSSWDKTPKKGLKHVLKFLSHSFLLLSEKDNFERSLYFLLKINRRI